MMTSSFVIAFVYFSNLVAIIMLAYMLFRILGQTKETHKALRKECERLDEASKRSVLLIASTERLNERLTSTHKLIEDQRNALQLHPKSLDQLVKLGESANPALLDRMNRSVEEIQGTLAQLCVQNQADGSTQGEATDITTLEAIRVAAAQHSNEVTPIKRRLDTIQDAVNDLLQRHRASDADNRTNKALNEKLVQQEALLSRASERAQRAEGTIQALEKSIEQLTALVGQPEQGSPQSDPNLSKELEALRHERSALRGQLDDIQDTLKRTLIEKDFIEDKLLSLDEVAGDVLPKAYEAASSTASTSTAT